MSLETETTRETTTFEHFGRTWTVPVRRHLSHIKRMRDEMRSGIGSWNLLVVETFLPPEELDELLEIDPDEDALNGFVREISKVLGTGDPGNSEPSSASS